MLNQTVFLARELLLLGVAILIFTAGLGGIFSGWDHDRPLDLFLGAFLILLSATLVVIWSGFNG